MKTHIREYHMVGCSNLISCKKNAVVFSTSETTAHKLAKCIGAIMLHKHGDVKFTEDMKFALDSLSRIVDEAMEGFVKEKHDFICEACPNKEKTRRVDLVDVTNNNRFEFETKKSVDKGEGVTTIYL